MNLLRRKVANKFKILLNQGLSGEFANLLKILEGQTGYARVMCVRGAKRIVSM